MFPMLDGVLRRKRLGRKAFWPTEALLNAKASGGSYCPCATAVEPPSFHISYGKSANTSFTCSSRCWATETHGTNCGDVALWTLVGLVLAGRIYSVRLWKRQEHRGIGHVPEEFTRCDAGLVQMIHKQWRLKSQKPTDSGMKEKRRRSPRA